MGRNLVIPDIHGCYNTFAELLKKIKLTKEDNLYLLGDYIDRGKNSDKVVDLIIELSETHNIFPIMGNHEKSILEAQEDYDKGTFAFFVKRFGKSKQLLDENKQIKKKYYDFLINLPLYYKIGNFILVHAGLDFSNDNIFENETAILNLRGFNEKSIPKDFDRIIVRGHEITYIEEIREAIKNKSKVISLDNGCVYNKKHKVYDYTKLRHLCCFNLDTYELILQENVE